MRFTKKIKGMAMLEVLIAMLIFALTLIPLVRLQVMSMAATKAGVYKTETAAAAESMMDYLRTDVGAIFKTKWDNVVVLAGENCKELKAQEKVACEILNSPNDTNVHADNNAVLCIFGKRPKYGPSDAQKDRDQYLISIRAIWYSGKREKPDPKDPKSMYYEDLKKADCGNGYDSDMKSEVVDNDNIDSIKINMAY